MYIQRWGIFLYHMWTKKCNSAEVKPAGTRHIQTQVNSMMQSTTWSISIGNIVGKAGTENTFVYTIFKPVRFMKKVYKGLKFAI
jgi:hypothetical protein